MKVGEANTIQVAGDHYKSEFQHWDWVVANNMDYFRANATKYITRHKKKNGLADLLKAMHYLTKLQELLKNGVRPLTIFEPRISKRKYQVSVAMFCSINGLDDSQRQIMEAVLPKNGIPTKSGMYKARRLLNTYTEACYGAGHDIL